MEMADLKSRINDFAEKFKNKYPTVKFRKGISTSTLTKQNSGIFEFEYLYNYEERIKFLDEGGDAFDDKCPVICQKFHLLFDSATSFEIFENDYIIESKDKYML